MEELTLQFLDGMIVLKDATGDFICCMTPGVNIDNIKTVLIDFDPTSSRIIEVKHHRSKTCRIER